MVGMDETTADLFLEIRESPDWRAILDELSESGMELETLLDRVGIGHDEAIDLLNRSIDSGLIERVADKGVAITERGETALEYATRDWNPSNPGTKRGRTFEILSDCEWHCPSCELPSTQSAKDIQMLRKEGFEFVQESGQGQGEYRDCPNCGETTFHRRLKYPFPTARSITRQAMPDSFKRRVRDLYDHRDAFDGSSPSTTLEVDHRVPEIRWDEPESFDFENMSDAEIKEHFQVLTRRNNLLKSRKCERCAETGRRPPFMGVEFYYAGDERYDEEFGCVGCGWYDPQEWRRRLNHLLNRSELG